MHKHYTLCMTLALNGQYITQHYSYFVKRKDDIFIILSGIMLHDPIPEYSNLSLYVKLYDNRCHTPKKIKKYIMKKRNLWARLTFNLHETSFDDNKYVHRYYDLRDRLDYLIKSI